MVDANFMALNLCSFVFHRHRRASLFFGPRQDAAGVFFFLLAPFYFCSMRLPFLAIPPALCGHHTLSSWFASEWSDCGGATWTEKPRKESGSVLIFDTLRRRDRELREERVYWESRTGGNSDILEMALIPILHSPASAPQFTLLSFEFLDAICVSPNSWK